MGFLITKHSTPDSPLVKGSEIHFDTLIIPPKVALGRDEPKKLPQNYNKAEFAYQSKKYDRIDLMIKPLIEKVHSPDTIKKFIEWCKE